MPFWTTAAEWIDKLTGISTRAADQADLVAQAQAPWDYHQVLAAFPNVMPGS